MRRMGTGIIGRVGALLLSIAIVGCGDNGVTPPIDAPDIDAPDIDAPTGPTISDVPDQTISEDGTTGSLGFTVGDTSVAVGSLTVTATSNNTTIVPNANIVLGGSGATRTVTVTPVANAFGSADITLTVSNGQGGMASSTFTVTVTSVNDLPTISNIADQTVQEGTATTALNFTVGDAETPAASLTVTATSSNTTLVPASGLVFAGTGANRTLTVTPSATGTGTATITVTVSDGTGTATDTFVLTVNAPTLANDPPVNVVPGAQTANEDVNLVFNPGNNNAISTSDIDAGTGAVMVTLGVTNTTGNVGTLSLSGTTGLTFTSGDGTADASMVFTGTISDINAALNNLTLNVPANGSGTGTLSITTNDQGNTGTGGPLSDTDSVSITVNAVNDLPTITTIADQNIAEDTSTSALNFSVADVETAAGALVVTASSSNTALVPNGNVVLGGTAGARTVTVTPLVDVFGTAIITLTVTDANGGSSTTSFTVQVNNVNDGPTIQDVTNQSMNLGDTLTIPFTVGDIDNNVATLSVTAMSSDQGVTGLPTVGGSGANRTVTFTPTTIGSATITLSVTDGALTALDTFVLTINNVNDAPVITVPGTQTAHVVITGTSAQRTFAFNASNRVSVADPDSGTADIVVTLSIPANKGTLSVPAVAGLTVAGNGTNALVLTGTQTEINTALQSLTFESASGQFGSVLVTVTADDNGNSGTPGVETDMDQFTINVNAQPMITFISGTPVTVNEDGTTTFTFSVADPDGTVAEITTNASSNNAVLLSNPVPVAGAGATRTVTITPNANQNNVRSGGPATVTVSASDAVGGAVQQTFLVNVTPVNDAPINVVPGAQTGIEDGTIVVNGISFSDLDTVEVPSTVMTATLSTTGASTSPVIQVATSAGVTITNNQSNTVTLTGTQANLLSALAAGVTLRLDTDEYNTPTPPGDGTRMLTVAINDGNNGGGGALTDTDMIGYAFAAVNDAPVHSNVSGLVTLTTNAQRSGLNVDVADIDLHDLSATAEMQVTISSTEGAITLTTTTGLDFGCTGCMGDGTADATMIFNGTLTEVNNALTNFTFTPNLNFMGDARIQVTTNDLGNFPITSGAKLATSDIYTTYAVGNTAPTITAVADVTVAEDTATTALPFTIGDAQTNPSNLNVSVTADNGAFAVLGGSGASRTVTVTPALNYNGLINVTVTVNDGSLTAMDTFVVTVTPVNDAPTLAPLADITRPEDFGTSSISFSAGDVETPGMLVVTVTTDNPGLIGISNITGNSFNITSVADLSGTANITVAVSDGMLLTQDTFLLTVTPVNDVPTVTGSGQIIVDDKEASSLRVRLRAAAGQTISLGATTGVTFVDVGGTGATAFTPDGTVDGDGLNDQLIGIQGTKAALNAALDDLVISGGVLDIRVDDLAGSASGSDYAGTSGIATATRTAPFGPNTFGQIRMFLTDTATASPFPATSRLLSTMAPSAGVSLISGRFDEISPGNSGVGQWNPGIMVSANTDATEIGATPNRGWLYDVDLNGETISAGTWSAQFRLAEALAGSTLDGRIFVKVSVVTGTAGAYTTVANLLTARNLEGSPVTGWRDAEGSTIAVPTNANNFSVSFTTGVAHTFLAGERLLIEVGFGDVFDDSYTYQYCSQIQYCYDPFWGYYDCGCAQYSTQFVNPDEPYRAWRLDFNNGASWIQTPQ
ncbi:MAG: Repeat family [Myxococcales bacterium]|nr:Repeat family [Myxococcales bacterium]